MTVRGMAQMNPAYLSYVTNQRAVTNQQKSLNSGYKVNSASDNAAGLAISESMRGQIGGLNSAEVNAQNGVSIIQTAEGGLNSTADTLTRMRELAVQASSGTYSDEDRAVLSKEFDALKESLNNIAASTNYNGKTLLDGSLDAESGGSELVLQIGANGGADQRAAVSIGDMSSEGLGLKDIGIGSISGANSALKALDEAINATSAARGGLGAVQNRLESTINNIGVTKENLTASESTIRDADYAKKMMEYTRNNIMMQASQSMMAQSMNLSRQNALSLLLR